MKKATKKVSEVIIKDTAKPLPVTLGKSEVDEIYKHKTKPPETTEEEDRSTLGQRRINVVWEYTQAFIACVVVFTAMFAAVWVVVVDRVIKVIPADASLASAWTIIATSIGLVVGFYFSRTNHSAIGGTGKKPQSSDKGTR